jgi:hypothetical protein
MQCFQRLRRSFLLSQNGFVKQWKDDAGNEAGISGTETNRKELENASFGHRA